MIVFKNYFKIVKSLLPTILVFVGIFLLFAVLSNSGNQATTDFMSSKPKVAIINEDDSVITNAFIEFTEKNTERKELENEEETIKDALFYRYVDYILVIPKGFGSSVINNQPMKIKTLKVPDSTDSIYAEMLFNNFLKVASIYNQSGMSETQIADNLSKTFANSSDITIVENQMSDLENVKLYFNFANYPILSICILVIGIILAIYNQESLRKRNIVSSYSYRKMNFSLYCGNMITMMVVWLLFTGITFVLYPNSMLTTNGLLFAINLLALSFTALSIGTLLGNLVHNQEAQNGIINVIALGSSFLCGAFVPQAFLGESVLKIAHILPSYWYIKNNEIIAELSSFHWTDMQAIVINIAVVLIFGIVFFIINNIISRYRRKVA